MQPESWILLAATGPSTPVPAPAPRRIGSRTRSQVLQRSARPQTPGKRKERSKEAGSAQGKGGPGHVKGRAGRWGRVTGTSKAGRWRGTGAWSDAGGFLLRPLRPGQRFEPGVEAEGWRFIHMPRRA